MGRLCLHAQDNVGQCGVGQDHTRQDMSENGCLQNWGGQICGCAAEGYTPPFSTQSACDGRDVGSNTICPAVRVLYCITAVMRWLRVFFHTRIAPA
jgi:hypothetical protein